MTAKVQKELGVKPRDLAEPKPNDSSILGNWYVNLFTVDRRKTFIFVNEKTLLSFIIFGVKKTNIKKMPEIFLRGLDQLLVFEGINIKKINKVFHGYEEYEYTKTISKVVLGNMNDLVALYKHSILYEGGLKYIDVGELIMQVNRTPQRNLDWSKSIDKTKKLLSKK